MTIWEWFGTWYFWGPLFFLLGVFIWLAYVESQDDEDLCPTCYSDKRKKRYPIRYHFGEIQSIRPCTDPWHGHIRTN